MARSTNPLDSGSRGAHNRTPMPNVPRNSFIDLVSSGRPARHLPTADSLSHTKVFGSRPHPRSSSQCPASRSGLCRVGNIRAVITREKPDTSTNTGGRAT